MPAVTGHKLRAGITNTGSVLVPPWRFPVLQADAWSPPATPNSASRVKRPFSPSLNVDRRPSLKDSSDSGPSLMQYRLALTNSTCKHYFQLGSPSELQGNLELGEDATWVCANVTMELKAGRRHGWELPGNTKVHRTVSD